MKDFVKKLGKSLKAFPVGVLMLAISYILVYYWDGEATYLIALSKLTSIKTLIYEVIVAGVTYIALSLLYLYVIPYLQKMEERNPKDLRYSDLLRYIIICVCIIVVVSAFICIEKVTALEYTFDEEVETVFFGTLIIVLIFSAIYYFIARVIETKAINKVLKSLKEKRNKNEEKM
jgi:quinol-cytochrome oxidoreductase complex cytochrome b subunit